MTGRRPLLALTFWLIAAFAGQGGTMTTITLTARPAPAGPAPHRLIHLAPEAPLLTGAMADPPALVLRAGDTPRLTLPLLLPSLADFDVTDRGGHLLVAHEFHGGATSDLRLAAESPATPPDLAPRNAIVSETRPRFVRGDPSALTLSEDGMRAILVSAGARRVLCDCLDAMAIATGQGLAILSRQLRPGPMRGGLQPGTMTLTWPGPAGAVPLFDGAAVHDHDALALSGRIVIAAVTDRGLRLAVLAPGAAPVDIPVTGLPQAGEAFSPTLAASGSALHLALLVAPTGPGSSPVQILSATLPLPLPD